jgi:uncharacterized protein YndB with AHSA1/START domain
MTPDTLRELVLTRDIPVTPDKLFAAWTQPELMVQWFTPKPWETVRAEVDLRPGGSSLVVMRSPEGEEFPNSGVYLEVVPNQRLVATSAFTKAWDPVDCSDVNALPMMIVIILTFDDLGNGSTRYTATVKHWSVADREKHEAMGFYPGWGLATDQLTELVTKL